MARHTARPRSGSPGKPATGVARKALHPAAAPPSLPNALPNLLPNALPDALPVSPVRIGISGWRYAGWRGHWYPPKLPQRSELAFAAGQFRTIEINGTFYSPQRPESFRRWAAETPHGFVFSIKGARLITHMRKLLNVEEAFSNFFAQGLLLLGAKLGPVLWQFPPNFHYDPARFAAFFGLLPRTTAAAAALAQAHGPRLRGRVWTETDRDRPLEHAVEIRHESFAVPGFIDLLREHAIGLVVADTVEWPLLFDLTAGFVYCRLHGSEQLYASGYGEAELARWAERVAGWASGGKTTSTVREAGAPVAGDPGAASLPTPDRFAHSVAGPPRPRAVYVYFDNDIKVRAPYDAARLAELVAARLATGDAPRS